MDKPAFVHKLLCQDTVEERIHKLQQENAKLAAGLLADADISARLDTAMVRALLEEYQAHIQGVGFSRIASRS